MLVNREPSLTIQGQTVRAGLPIFANIETCVAAVGAVNRYLSIRVPPVYKVIVRIAEEQVAAVAVPHRPFCELKPTREPLNLGARGQDGIEPRILFEYLSFYRNDACTFACTIKIEDSGLYPNEIVRAG